MRFAFYSIVSFLRILVCCAPLSSVYAQELLGSNRGFELGTFSEWSHWGSGASITSDAFAGSFAARMSVSGNSDGTHYATLFTYNNGQQYTLNVVGKISGSFAWAGFGIHYLDVSNNQISQHAVQVTETSYTTFTELLTPPPGTVRMRLWFWASGTGTLSVDQFSFVQTAAVLPIRIVNFMSTPRHDKRVELVWDMEGEWVNAEFQVQQSVDGSDWKTTHTIASSGYPKEQRRMVVVIDNLFEGHSFVRVKCIAADGTVTFSPFRAVFGEQQMQSNIKVFPNPARTRTIVTGMDGDRITIYNIRGQDMTPLTVMNRRNTSGIELDLSKLPAALYFVKSGNSVGMFYKE
jgi:hypothetical protein